MKSIKQQYIDLQEGNMSQANFMRNLRMTMPQYITNVTSFNDSVKILRNKGILTEADISMPKDTFDKVKKVVNDLTAKNEDYHRDGYTMGYFEEGMNNDDVNESHDANVKWLEDIKDIIEDRWQNGKITPPEYGSAMTQLSQNPESIIDQYGEYRADEAANELLNSVSHVGSEYDPGPGEDENFERDYDTDYEEPNEPFDMAESLTEAKDEKGKWTNANGKSMYGQFKELDNLNGHEVMQGIDWEMQCNPELSKKDIIKKVIKNLKKNPIYYTSWDMSGVEGYEPETMGPKSDIAARQMQYLDKNMSNVIDKKMGMQPVKGIEKPKKDSDAKKETNTPEKGITLMSLIAKTVRGVKKMDATGEKMKKIGLKEGEVTTNWDFNKKEKEEITHLLGGDVDFDREEEEGQTVKTTVSSKTKNDKTIRRAISQATGEIKDNADHFTGGGAGVAKFLTKEDLMKMIREELNEMFKGIKLFANFGSYSDDNTLESRFARSISEVAREYEHMDNIEIPEFFDEYEDGDDFYAGPTEALDFFQSLPDEFVVTNNMNDVNESFKITKTGPDSFIAKEI